MEVLRSCHAELVACAVLSGEAYALRQAQSDNYFSLLKVC